MENIKRFGHNIWAATQLFIDKQLITMAAALAYYAIFALPPLLLILLTSTKRLYFWGTTENYIFDEIQSLLGKEATTLLINSMEHIATFDGSWIGIAVSIALIIFSSTSVFIVIQNGFNRIFEVEANPGVWRSINLYILNRLTSLGIMLGLAFLLVISLTFHIAVTALSKYLFGSAFSSNITEIMGAFVLPLILLVLFFGLMLRVLPDVKLKFRDVWPGAIFTAILLVIGKYAIGAYIGNSSFSNTYASASSLIVLLIWSYFSSILIFFGCAYLRCHIESRGGRIEPADYAERTHRNDMDKKADEHKEELSQP